MISWLLSSFLVSSIDFVITAIVDLDSSLAMPKLKGAPQF